MELKMRPYTLPDAMSFNYEELKAALVEKAELYTNMVYTDEQISAAKADRANLNRLKKALNDERIKREKEYMQPFATFKAQVNEIIGIIDRPVQVIDKQVKAFEDQKRAEKQQAIIAYWDETGAPEWLHTIDTKWLNASYSMKTIQAEIDANIAQAEKDLAVIRALPAYAFEAEDYYKGTQSLAEAVSEAHRLQEQAARKAAHEAEEAKRKAEEAARMEAVELKPTPQLGHDSAQPCAPKLYTVSFRATMTIEQARELKDFFLTRGIEYEKI